MTDGGRRRRYPPLPTRNNFMDRNDSDGARVEATPRRLDVPATPSSPASVRQPFSTCKNATWVSCSRAGDEASPLLWPSPNCIVPVEEKGKAGLPESFQIVSYRAASRLIGTARFPYPHWIPGRVRLSRFWVGCSGPEPRPAVCRGCSLSNRLWKTPGWAARFGSLQLPD